MPTSEHSIYFYNPSLPATLVFMVLYIVPTVVLFFQACFKPKSLYLLVLPLGALVEVAGYAGRAYSVKHVTDVVSTFVWFIFANCFDEYRHRTQCLRLSLSLRLC
jgi:hypothetical protein